MWGENAKVRWLMMITSAIGAIVLGSSLYHTARIAANPVWLVLVVLAVALSFVGTIKIPGARAQISVSDPVVFTGALLFGPYLAAILAALDSGFQSVRFSRKVSVCAYNMATMTTSIYVSTLIVDFFFPHIMGDASLSFDPAKSIAPMGLLALLHYFINTMLIAAVVALRQKHGILKTWFENFQWSSTSYIAGAATAGCICFLVKHVGPIAIVVVTPTFVGLYILYRVYLGKVETKNQQVAELSSVYNQVLWAKAEWDSTFDAMSDPVFLFDSEGRLNRINKAGLTLSNGQTYEDLLGKNCCELGVTCSPNICRVRHILLSSDPEGDKWTSEIEKHERAFVMKCDPVRDDQGTLRSLVIVLTDITAYKNLREQVLYSEKMATVGQLVAGVGHEINNPLNAIMGFTNIALLDDRLSDKTRRHLEIVVSQALRTRKSIQTLLTFARQHKPKKAVYEINAILQQVLELVENDLQLNSITLSLDLPELPKVLCDSPQLQQVFLSVIINAEQSMLRAYGRGHLEIKGHLSENKVVISVRDNSPGLSPENLKRIFDPVFTTTETGTKNGLGLSICYGLIQEHGGRFYAESKLGRGTTFFIELPVATESSLSLNSDQPQMASIAGKAASENNQSLVADGARAEQMSDIDAQELTAAGSARNSVDFIRSAAML
jgi:PAS domain S-box-containing protein